jgi:hypothetical protein
VTLDLYDKYTKGMIVKATIPVTAGYSDTSYTPINAGTMDNKGIELSINSLNLTGELRWETQVVASYNRNRVLNLNSDTPIYQNQVNNNYLTILNVGYPMNTFYGYIKDGIFQTPAEVASASVQVAGGTAAGDIRFKDIDNNGVIDENDRTFIGNPNPAWLFSMTNTLSYKGFDLSLYLQGIAGNKIYNVNNIDAMGMASANNQIEAVTGRWQGEGSSNTMPRAVFADPNQNNRPSTHFVEDGSYLRVKNLTFGYNLPQSLLKKIDVERVRVYMTCQNLLTFTKYTGFDPEVGINGLDSSRYPISRTIGFGLNLTF